MKIKELIEKLKKFDENMDVITEGCDCDAYAVDVKEHHNNCILITR